jgi:hypothetical protein
MPAYQRGVKISEAAEDVLDKSLSTLMVVFRGVVRLHGQVPSQDYEALTRSVAQKAGFSPDPFIKVIRHARGTEKLPKDAASVVLEEYLGAMETLVGYLDKFQR